MKKTFDIGICTFSYGGNGGISSEVPDIREWMVSIVPDIVSNKNIGEFKIWNLSNTPVTMTRNKSVLMARQAGVDIMMMVDSDMRPDLGTKPFFETSLNYIIDHYDRGPLCIGAPYCGPPPDECVYVFRWQNRESDCANPDFQLEMYDRHTAASLSGIQEVAALPTGLVMFDMRCFDLTEPKNTGDQPWFYYEYLDMHQSEKASTEDVTMTRDLSVVGSRTLGYNPVLCNWDAWAGHWKPKCVGPPKVLGSAELSAKLSSDWRSETRPMQVELSQKELLEMINNGNKPQVHPV